MLFLYQSNSLERLFDGLCHILAEPLPDPFAAEQVVVQNQGMAHWLSRMIARRSGIAANISYPLPARFMWEIFASQLDLADDMGDFDRSVLLWRILGVLPTLSREKSFTLISSYLQDDVDGRKAFQLAGRISDLFDQYLVYRPDMLLEWEEGRDEGWQAILWRSLTVSGTMHRARLIKEFRNLRQENKLKSFPAGSRVCLFGISSMAPVYLELIDGIREMMDIHLLHLSPCRDYWGDLVSGREMARKRAGWRKKKMTDVSEYYMEGNPLLASFGTVGREFSRQLSELEIHDNDLYTEPAGDSLLTLLQRDMLDLADRSGPDSTPRAIREDDRSVQFHVCYSLVREIQVLHDRLLEMFEGCTDLLPGEILVMAPDMGAYASAVSAVFGAAADGRTIPWSLVDRSYHDEQPMARVFLALLDLPASRLTATEVLSLLEIPSVRKRFGVQGENLDLLRSWVRESGICWGLDALHRQRFNLDMSGLHSWSFGLDRLLFGYLAGAGADMYKGIAPGQAVSGGESILLGQLAAFVDTLRTWHEFLDSEGTAAEWAVLLLQLLDDVFDPSGSEADEDFLIHLRKTVADFADYCQRAGFTGKISLSVVRTWLSEALTSSSGGHAFLSGRVTFCNMVPMRSVPFRVICLLGMNDTVFPRIQRPPAFDLMAENPRLGDRNRRNDDCYMFLEALLSARDVLYLSWKGQDQRDNSVWPPSIVVSGLRDYIDRSFFMNAGEICEKLTVSHPLQPFSSRCFDGSPGTASYAGEWLPSGRHPERSFLQEPLTEADDEWQQVDFDRLVRFWSHPARFFLQERLGLKLREADDTLAENEPFSPDFIQRYLLIQDCVAARLSGVTAEQQFARMAAEGKLPHGSFGVNLFRDMSRTAETLALRLAPLVAQPVEAVQLNACFGDFVLAGWLDSLYAGGCIRYRAAVFKGKDLLALWLRHLALNLIAPDQCEMTSCHVATDRTVVLKPVKDAGAELQKLLHYYWQGLTEPLHFYPETSLAWLEAQRKGKGREGYAAETSWNGSLYTHGEADDPAYRIALKGIQPLDHRFEECAASVVGPILDHLENADADI